MLVEIVLGALLGAFILGFAGCIIGVIAGLSMDLDSGPGPGSAIGAAIGLLAGAIGIGIFYDNETHEGTATGYVTAVERGGVFYTTTGVYLKTDLESTQEDRYCLADRSLEETLRQAAGSNQRVEVRFKEYFWHTDGCEFEDGTTIVSVRYIGGA